MGNMDEKELYTLSNEIARWPGARFVRHLVHFCAWCVCFCV